MLIKVLVLHFSLEDKKVMNAVRLFLVIYCFLSCLVCPIHMWRYRKNKEMVKIYFITFLICLLDVVAMLKM